MSRQPSPWAARGVDAWYAPRASRPTLKNLNWERRGAKVSYRSMTGAVPDDPWMIERPRPAFGERAISWRTVWNDLYPDPWEPPTMTPKRLTCIACVA